MAEDVVGSLAVRVGADISGLVDGLKKADGHLTTFGGSVVTAGKYLAATTVAAGAAAAAIGVSLTRAGLDAIDANAKLARTLGGTIDGLRGLQLAGADAGVSTDMMKSAMERLNAKLGEAQRGTGTANDALQNLGLTAQQLSGMDIDERMATIADRVTTLGLSSQQTADQLRQLGIKNAEMVELMMNGGDAIRGAREELEAYGIAVSAVDAAKVEMANDAFERIGLITEGISTQLAIQLAPILQGIVEIITDAAKEFGGLGNVIKTVIGWAIKGVGFLADVFRGLHVVVKGVQIVFAAFIYKSLEGVKLLYDNFAKLANIIPGVNFKPIEGLNLAVDTAREATVRLQAEMMNLVTTPMPSDKIDKWLKDTVAASDKAAQEIAKRQAQRGPGIDMPDEGEAEKQKKQQESLDNSLAQLVQSQMTEIELERVAYGEKLAVLNEAMNAKALTIEEYNALEQSMYASHQVELATLENRAAEDRLKNSKDELERKKMMTQNALSWLSTAMDGNSKKMFAVGKVAALSQATINAYEAITSAYKVGSLTGPWTAAAYAAAASVAQFGVISKIKSQSYGGGGGGGGSTTATSTPTALVQQSNLAGASGGGGGDKTFTIQGLSPGQLFSGSSMKQLLEAIEEAAGDGRTRIVIQ